METIYDWTTVAIFAGLVVLFLQRTMADEGEHQDSIFHYLAAGAGCALANYAGNAGNDLIAVLLICATIAFIFIFLKPFGTRSS